jgi:hypothetical protein
VLSPLEPFVTSRGSNCPNGRFWRVVEPNSGVWGSPASSLIINLVVPGGRSLTALPDVASIIQLGVDTCHKVTRLGETRAPTESAPSGISIDLMMRSSNCVERARSQSSVTPISSATSSVQWRLGRDTRVDARPDSSWHAACAFITGHGDRGPCGPP